MRAMKRALLVLALFPVAACSSDDGIAAKDLPTQLIKADCKNAVTCQLAPDEASCEASLQANSTQLLTLEAAIAANHVKYDSSKAAACVSERANASCAFQGFMLSKPTSSDPCNEVFVGLVAANGACFDSLECANGGLCSITNPQCDPTTTCCPGTCMAPPAKIAIGQTCQATSDCVTGAYCTDTTKQCAAVVSGVGTACAGIDGCADPLVCNFDQGTSMFTTCYQQAARGAACDTTKIAPCADERDYCDTTTMKCTQNVSPGATCNGTNGATCVGYADCTNGSCVAKATAGQTCTVNQFGQSNCLGALACNGGSCQLPAAGMTCM
jgi:hypothetical protein